MRALDARAHPTGTPRGFAVKRRLLVVTILGVLVALALVIMAPVAFGGDVTRIIYAQNQNDLNYYKVGATAGTFNVSLSWTKADGTGAPVFPVAEADGLVFGPGPHQPMYDDITPPSLYEDVNPETASLAAQANGEYWFGVAPYVGDVPYQLVVTFTPSGGSATVVINVTKTAFASDGSVVFPAAGNVRGVFQSYDGTLDRRVGNFASDVWASWDMDMRGVGDPLEFLDDSSVNYAPGQPYAAPSAHASGVDALEVPIPAGDVGQQVLIIPQKWGTAARANVWNNPLTDVYPEPGTGQTFSQCPAWYTYSFPDGGDASTSRPTYTWPNLPVATASKHDVGFINYDPTLKLTYTFYGTSLTWLYAKFPTCGIASVSIDGAPGEDVDQWAATTTLGQSHTWSNLSDGPHTVVITETGRKNPSATNRYLTHDGFIAKQVNDADPYTAAENNYDGMTTYAWPTLTLSGATISFINYDPTDAVAFTFQGDSIKLKWVGLPTLGIQNVYVDGQPQAPCDQYTAGVTTGLTQTWSGFGLGTHTLLMMPSGNKNTGAANRYMDVDAFGYGSPTTWYEN
jgi:hypothetical protein